MDVKLNQVTQGPTADLHNLILREGNLTDCDAILQLFRETVLAINVRDYTTRQIQSLAASADKLENWHEHILSSYFLLAELNGQLVGFCSVSKQGYLSTLYVHKDHQANGIGRKLLRGIEKFCRSNFITEIWSDVSITARHFFARHGFSVESIYSKSYNDCEFETTLMRKLLLDRHIN